ncbi:exported hypothetical protein [Candidatus Sulfotelmatomonas gaucii]|uniref:DUF3224 domain-containing protein n=1 Tax=Candidatus Sulfuritelmatomonas gaucii TaxID=2043161 RepID=A0A2N9LNY9_9BACT|nr:exported hypothetical protein [Candidatus Sulfotelmatomonas gaucii]
MSNTLILAAALLATTISPAGRDQTRTGSRQIEAMSRATGQGRSEPEEFAQMNNHESIQAVGHSQASSHQRAHAEATVTVQNSQAEPFDQSAEPALNEVHLTETFAGDMDGESSVRAFQVRLNQEYASLVSMQRFHGKLGDRKGTFVLQGSEVVENGSIKATWFVVPGSGTGELLGLRGEGGFAGEFGKGSKATLDYWFE